MPVPRPLRAGSARGSASPEFAGLVALIAVALLLTVVALPGTLGPAAGSGAVRVLANRIACSPRVPGPCRRDPLLEAYGSPVAHVVRALAPAPSARAGPDGGGLVGVDFRRCRRPGCAVPSADRPAHLTTAGRRTTAFVSVARRRHAGAVAITYWVYRPALGWGRIERRAGPEQVAAAHRSRLTEDQDPVLIPLETLPGRNLIAFSAAERPQWQPALPR